ncbi:MAG: cell division protein ZapA [Deltaproteobacteria bacterium]|nr:cell division protein ZapA [Deltaproteobacteria bacterium]MBW2361474.1 cell division protein ZapA [Deltaproteobacteria bacterium]
MERELIAIRIRGQEYRVRNDGDAESLQRIAGYLNETMAQVEERTGTIDSLGVATLTALNLARELVELREGGGVPADTGRLQQLIELAETALEGAAPVA